MALATNTQPGEIQLAGDLGGNNDATAPELSDSGVAAGQYLNVQLTVDGKGRVTNAQGGDPTTISAVLQNASSTQRGVVQAGAGLDVTTNDAAGYQEIVFSTSITGSETTGLDTCASYLIDINIDALPTQQIIVKTNVATIQDVVDEINLVLSGAVASIAGGVIHIVSNTIGRNSLVEIVNDALFGCMSGFNNIDPLVRGYADCEMFATDATTSLKGVVQIGSNIDVTAGVISVSPSALSPATDSTLGGVIVPAAGNLEIDVSGNISVPISSDIELGVLKVPGGDGLSVDVAGNLTFDTSSISDATTSSKGIVQIGSNIDVAAGVISIPDATLVSKGVVQIDDTNGLSITAGVVDIDIATTNSLGVVQVPGGDGLSVDGAGELTFVTTSLSDATTSSKGVVQIGSNIDVAAGVISVPIATTLTKGVVQIDTTNGLSVSSGIVDIDIATTNSLGVIQVPGGDGLSVDVAGNLTLTPTNLPDATVSSKGIVQIGSNISVTAGVISVLDGTNTVKGAVKSANTNNISISSGQLDVGPNIAKTNVSNNWTAAQVMPFSVLTFGATVNVDVSLSNVFGLDVTGNFTLAAPTNMAAGGRHTFLINQDATGGHLITFDPVYKFRFGSDKTLSTGSNETDILTCLTDGTNMYCSLAKEFV